MSARESITLHTASEPEFMLNPGNRAALKRRPARQLPLRQTGQASVIAPYLLKVPHYCQKCRVTWNMVLRPLSC